MTFEQLQYFCVLSEHLSFTKASDALFISQPTLSRQISLLEDELGATLFQRANRRIYLTTAGEILYQAAPEILKSLDAVKERIRYSISGHEGTLRIASLNFFYPELYNAYQKFTQTYPNVEFSIYKSNGDVFATKYRDAEIDVSVGFDFELNAQAKDVNLDILPLYQERFCVVMSAQHLLAKEPALTLSQIRSQRLLFLGRMDVPFVHDLWTQADLSNVKSELRRPDSIEDILLQVKADGKSISLVPYPSIEIMPAGCIAKEIVNLDSRFQLVMAWRKDNKSPVLASFLDIIKETFQAGPLPPPKRDLSGKLNP